MSATNRGAPRQEADFYPTPLESFTPLIPYIKEAVSYFGGYGQIWEPACGDRRLIDAMRAEGLYANGMDLKDGYDFLNSTTNFHLNFYSAIVTNPPFSLAQEFVEKATSLTPHVFLLLRLNFLESKKRRDWWRTHTPSALFILSSRPRFINNRSDACAYAWFYWGTTHTGIHFL